MIRTTREKGGIRVEVIRDDTNQVIWRKFVPWRSIDRLPEVFAHASREQERYGKKGGGHGRANNRNPGTTVGPGEAGESAIEDGGTKQDS